MKLRKHLRPLLLLVGFGLLAFYGAAKLHQHLLSRAAMCHFHDLRIAPPKEKAQEHSGRQLVAALPDFVSWSQNRIQQYELSLIEHISPPLAVIHIDRVHIEAPVLQGTDDITLNRGVGHISGTAFFGENGNVGIAGHRDGFFRRLKDVKVGDRIDMEEPDRTESYIVDRLEIVGPKDVSVLRSGDKPSLTLVTCYPFYFIGAAPQRFIVHAALASDPQTGANAISD